MECSGASKDPQVAIRLRMISGFCYCRLDCFTYEKANKQILKIKDTMREKESVPSDRTFRMNF